MGASARKDLPISDYDELTEGALRERVRGLTEQQLRQLLDYETEHAKRPAVTAVLSTRLDDLAHGAKPPIDSAATNPGQPGRGRTTAGGSGVSPSTAAPPTSPPPHGNPAQSAQPKGNRGV
jgi:hypothetical protein